MYVCEGRTRPSFSILFFFPQKRPYFLEENFFHLENDAYIGRNRNENAMYSRYWFYIKNKGSCLNSFSLHFLAYFLCFAVIL